MAAAREGEGIDDSIEPAPLFIYNAWTDDLFPADEAIRFWRKTKMNPAATPFDGKRMIYGGFKVAVDL